MSDVKAKMHPIRLRLGRRPSPRWGSLQCSSRPPSWIKGGLLLTEDKRERKGKWNRGRGEEGGKRGRGRGSEFGIHDF